MVVVIPPHFWVALHGGALHLMSLFGGHAGSTLLGAAIHQGASTLASQSLAHVIAHIGSSKHLALWGYNYATGTMASAAAVSSALGAVGIAGTGIYGAYSLFEQAARIRDGGHGSSDIGDIVRIMKDFPCNNLSKDANSKGHGKLLNALFMMVFIKLDELYASLELKNFDGTSKKGIYEIKSCRRCDKCLDFNRKSSRTCECGCSYSAHEAVTWKESFLQRGLGSVLLMALADSLYKGLNRVGLTQDEKTTWSKTNMETDIEKCTDCGCYDFALEPPWRAADRHCVCGHNIPYHRKVKWSQSTSGEDIFMTCVTIIMDSFYQDLQHEMLVTSGEEVKRVTKESVFQVRPCGSCTDFDYTGNTNFTRWFMVAREIKMRSYCVCGKQDRDHSKYE